MFDQGSTEAEIKDGSLVGAVKPTHVPASDLPPAMTSPVATQWVLHPHLGHRRGYSADPL